MTCRASTFFILALFLMGYCVSCISTDTGYRYRANKIQLQTVNQLYRFLTYYDTQRYPLISAHRGGPGVGYPENAIETFEKNLLAQPLIIECDIQMTKDSVLVLMHDETVNRTTTGEGKVADYSLAELRALRLLDITGDTTAFRIPTLDEALQWGKGRVIFTLDVKRGIPYAAVTRAVRRNKAEPYSVIITYNADQAAEVHQLAPDLMISASIRSANDLLRLSDHNIPDTRLVAFVGTSEADKDLYDLLHGHGILCILGTIGNLDKQAATRGDERYATWIENGADIISTDRPGEAGKILRSYRKTHQLKSDFIK